MQQNILFVKNIKYNCNFWKRNQANSLQKHSLSAFKAISERKLSKLNFPLRSAYYIFIINIGPTSTSHPPTLRLCDTFFGECCGFCVIERLSCQMAGTNGPKKIESQKIYHGNIEIKYLHKTDAPGLRNDKYILIFDNIDDNLCY